MKNLITLTIIILLALGSCKTKQKSGHSDTSDIPDMAHNSKISVDWAGVYMGVLPCDDCEGIETQIRLREDLTYEMRTTYLGKDTKAFTSTGAFQWDDTGNRIILDAKEGSRESNLFQVGEDILFKLDKDGNRIEGNLAENYTLEKADFNTITDKRWKLLELQEKSITSEPEQRREAYLILHEEGNRITGNSGCNHFFGTYELLGENGIKISNIGATKMLCPDMEPENMFFRMMESVGSYSIEGETLILHESPASHAAKFEFSINED